MSVHRTLRVAILMVTVAAVAVTGAAVVLAAPGRRRRQRAAAVPARVLSISCPSAALGGQLPALVYLPAGYRPGGRRYAVVYFLHGLPASAQSYTQNAFVAQALASAGERAIVVAPQGARSAGSDREYLDWSPTEDWPRAISHDLTSCIDHRFRTIARRSGRTLVGLSAGGYGAFNVGLRNLATFGAVESWSGYFVATDPSGHHVLKLPTPAARRAATVPSGRALSRELAHWPALIAFYVGRSDDRFLDMNQSFDARLRRSGIPHVFRTYPGGHSLALWETQAPRWLTMALRYLATGHAQASPPPAARPAGVEARAGAA